MNKNSVETRSEQLKAQIAAMQGIAVLVVGDIMLDRFVYGTVERISPESPVPVLSVKREDNMLGGAGNAMSNLSGLGVKAIALSLIGDDADGQAVQEKAEQLGIDTDGLIRDASRPTIVKTRFLAGHQQLLRSDFEKNEPISKGIAAQLLSKAEALIPTVKSVIISDYGKGLLSRELITAIMTAAQKFGVPVIVDPKGQDFSIYKGATAITPNKKELSEATRGMAVNSDEEVITAAQSLINDCGVENVVATRSADGMSVIQKSGPVAHFKSADIEVFDVSGAGDTVIATIAASMGAGTSLVDSVALANLAGGIVVAKVGTAPIRASELELALDSDQGDQQVNQKSKAGAHSATIATWAEAAEQVRRWKARGLKTGFTNGCFDILHLGHVSYLNDARARCDRLIVGLNHDASVRILKGETRPIHEENARGGVLAALGAVDMVVLFGAENVGDDNTACDLLSAVQPDIYFKGGDYTIDQIPEAPTVKSYGGTVDIMPVYEGHSTTASIKKAGPEAA